MWEYTSTRFTKLSLYVEVHLELCQLVHCSSWSDGEERNVVPITMVVSVKSRLEFNGLNRAGKGLSSLQELSTAELFSSIKIAFNTRSCDISEAIENSHKNSISVLTQSYLSSKEFTETVNCCGKYYFEEVINSFNVAPKFTFWLSDKGDIRISALLPAKIHPCSFVFTTTLCRLEFFVFFPIYVCMQSTNKNCDYVLVRMSILSVSDDLLIFCCLSGTRKWANTALIRINLDCYWSLLKVSNF